MHNKTPLRLVETALLLAMATVLSMIKLLDLPYGGSITAAGSLPILLIAYRHGTGYGVFAAAVYALLQLLLGAGTLSYCTSAVAAVAVILLDFMAAFTVLGLGGIFRKPGRSQGQALVLGTVFTGGLRYLCHVIAGATVWAGLSVPTKAALWYSFGYNATYMLPETLITTLAAWYLSRAVDLSGDRPARAKSGDTKNPLPALIGAAALFFAAVADILLIAPHLQDAASGQWTAAGFSHAPWIAVAAVTGAGLLIWLICRRWGKRLPTEKK